MVGYVGTIFRRAGIIVRYHCSSSGRLSMMDGKKDIKVLFQDSDFIAVNKPWDVKVNSNIDTEQTVATLLHDMGVRSTTLNLLHHYHFVHRLDYATSGVLCIGLTKHAAKAAEYSFSNRLTKKYYIALIRGHVCLDMPSERMHYIGNSPFQVFCIDKGIGRDETTDFPNFYTTSDRKECQKPRSAITTMYVLQLGEYDNEPVTKVLFVPHTGRTHQLRVHSHYIGHAIVGDYTYSRRQDIKPERMMLHAYRLILPLATSKIDITAPDPFTADRKWQPSQTIMDTDEIIRFLNN